MAKDIDWLKRLAQQVCLPDDEVRRRLSMDEKADDDMDAQARRHVEQSEELIEEYGSTPNSKPLWPDGRP